ncbi:sulfotransferase [uncultured Draconibacterium sp.]|uniref:sulfotransferase family protein n=1 Tax=uncultured Draconibacterium sp. TaxID=1573823 RepID=UPI003216C7F7
MNSLPNFLIVGASKSGTSSLYHYLKQHPDIYLSDKQKEGRYFSQMPGNFKGPGDENITATITKDLESYKALFQTCSEEKAVGDISPEYLYFHEKSIPLIQKDLGPDVKIVLILRSPIDRAYSGYMHFKRDKRETLSFEEGMSMEEERSSEDWIWAWQYRNSGLYHKQVKAYLDKFENVKVIVFDDFENDAKAVLKELCIFLDVDASFGFNTEYKYNVSGNPKSKMLYSIESSRGLINFAKKIIPDKVVKAVRNKITGEKQMVKTEMNEATRKELIEFYRADILELQNLIQQDLSHWLK